jgi:hypothetical protein
VGTANGARDALGSAHVIDGWQPLVGAAARAVQGSADQALPDTLTEINLTTRKRTDTPIVDLHGVGLIGTRVVYFVQGRLHSVDGGLDVPLLGGSVHYWRVLART